MLLNFSATPYKYILQGLFCGTFLKSAGLAQPFPKVVLKSAGLAQPFPKVV
jgi:hypothetical protein